MDDLYITPVYNSYENIYADPKVISECTAGRVVPIGSEKTAFKNDPYTRCNIGTIETHDSLPNSKSVQEHILDIDSTDPDGCLNTKHMQDEPKALNKDCAIVPNSNKFMPKVHGSSCYPIKFALHVPINSNLYLTPAQPTEKTLVENELKIEVKYHCISEKAETIAAIRPLKGGDERPNAESQKHLEVQENNVEKGQESDSQFIGTTSNLIFKEDHEINLFLKYYSFLMIFKRHFKT